MSDYTDPELREQVKAEVTAGDKGGRPGQWSARKAQLVARLYKERGGGYTGDKEHEGEAAQHLDRWTQEEWQTADGSARARDGDTTHRYLPKEAWDRLSDEEKAATEQAKTGSDAQFVANPDAARAAGQAVREPWTGYDEQTVPQVLDGLRAHPRAVEAVRAHESATKDRKGVLQALPEEPPGQG